VACCSRHGTCLRRSETRNPTGGFDTGETWYVLNRAAAVTGRDCAALSKIAVLPILACGRSISLSPRTLQSASGLHQQNLGRQMAIVLDHRVTSAPTIQGKIEDTGEITGNFSEESAHELALTLRAGALPASIKYLEERTVGPSLGADSIRHGVQASVLSLLVVMIFMLFYYRISGANAVLALILNLLMLLAFLALSGAVLTLPGIAGVILTIGMGVDSNVLVFERIREEMRNGKSAAAASRRGSLKRFSRLSIPTSLRWFQPHSLPLLERGRSAGLLSRSSLD